MALRALPAVASMGSTFNEKLQYMAGQHLQYQHDKAVWDVWWKLLVVEHRRLVLLTLIPLLVNVFRRAITFLHQHLHLCINNYTLTKIVSSLLQQ